MTCMILKQPFVRWENRRPWIRMTQLNADLLLTLTCFPCHIIFLFSTQLYFFVPFVFYHAQMLIFGETKGCQNSKYLN